MNDRIRPNKIVMPPDASFSFLIAGIVLVFSSMTDSTERLHQDKVARRPNRLIHEKSPYLLQHAYNPVDWYPWGSEAIEKAREEDKPIFLSIGYSTCYWCHVMEREVFENDSIAELMSRWVISIKVDREERPEIDRIYMSALVAMTGSGGWPMSMFLTHDLVPFFGATYLPPETKYGRAGFPEVLRKIREVWVSDRDQIHEVSARIHDFLKQSTQPSGDAKMAGFEALDGGYQYHVRSYDRTNAGFSHAPKFPKPVSLNFLFRYHHRTHTADALSMPLETLRAMARGGIYDHIGGGFHRYATDERWHVPHFEKMLYDQAQLTVSYLEAYQMTSEKFFADVARDVLDYVERVMTAPEGGFYSAEDAESAVDFEKPLDKEEGAFYTWNAKDFEGVLTAEEARVFHYHFDVKKEGNVVADPSGEFQSENILHTPYSFEETADRFGLDASKTREIVEASKKKLFQERERRPRPHLDDKVLVSWNGLMISAFVRAHQVLEDDRYRETASRAADFVLKEMYNKETRQLLRRYRGGEARYEAHLEDYAFLVQSLLDLYEGSFDIRWLKAATELTDAMVERFYDHEHGGFFDTSGKDPTVIVRTKEWQDGAEPTGNSIAVLDLLRLSQMIDRKDYRHAAEASLAYLGQLATSYPQAVPQFLVALDFSLSKPKQIIVAGRPDDPRMRTILKQVHSRFIPNKVLLFADGAEGQKFLAAHVPFLASVKAVQGKPTAYVCEDYACDLPTSDVSILARLLDKTPAQKDPP